MRENQKFMEIQKMGFSVYVDEVIASGTSLCTEGRIFISMYLQKVKRLEESQRIKVIYDTIIHLLYVQLSNKIKNHFKNKYIQLFCRFLFYLKYIFTFEHIIFAQMEV